MKNKIIKKILEKIKIIKGRIKNQLNKKQDYINNFNMMSEEQQEKEWKEYLNHKKNELTDEQEDYNHLIKRRNLK